MPEISGIIQNYLRGSIESIGGESPVIESKTITENGTYTAPEGVDGYSPVVVNVPIPEPVIDSISILANGTYETPEGIDGFNPIIVDVPSKEEITLIVNENGTYTPSEGRVYNNVVVDVPDLNYITMGNMYNTWVQRDMALNFYGNKFNATWNGGSTLGCQIYSNFDISDFSLITIRFYVTDVHYYNPSLSEIYKIVLGVSSTKPTDYSNVNTIGTPLYIVGDNEWIYYTYAIPDETCYLYLNIGGWNMQEVEIKLS